MIQNFFKKIGLQDRKHTEFSEPKEANHFEQIRKILSGVGIWNETVTLVRLNDIIYSQVFFTKEYEPSPEQLLSDEFLIFHQTSNQGNIINNLGSRPLPELLSAEQYEFVTRAEFKEELSGYTINLPSDVQPDYLLLQNYGTNSHENLVLRANGQPYLTLDEWMSFLTEGSKINEGVNERNLALKIQKNFRSVSCHGVRLFHQVNDPLAIDLLAYANFFCESSCGVLARVFALCCTAAGLKARVWRLVTHTLTEVYIDGKYRVIDGDPNAARFYIDPNSPGEFLGLEDIWQFGKELFLDKEVPVIPDDEPELSLDEYAAEDRKQKRIIALTCKSKAKLLETPESLNQKLNQVDVVNLCLKLQPGEIVGWCYKDHSPWNATTARSFRDPTNTRILIKEVDFCSPEFNKHIDANGFQITGTESSQLDALSDTSALRIKLDATYPILDFIVDITVKSDILNAIGCNLYSNGKKVAEIYPINRNIKNKIRFRLRRALIRRHRNEALELVLKFNKGLIVSEMRAVYIFQASHLALPRFESGINHISLSGTNLDSAPILSFFSNSIN